MRERTKSLQRRPHSNGYTESSHNLNGGPGTLGLTYESDSVTLVTSSVGLQLDTQYALANDR